MLVDQEYLRSLTPVEIVRIKAYIDGLYRIKVTKDTKNYENLVTSVEKCPHCGSTHFVKNGFNPKHRQKYRCKDCRSIFLPTTGTLFSHSNVSYQKWSQFIACELNRMTLEEEVVQTQLSKTTCFHMRHKLYDAISEMIESQKLSGEIELDPTYTKINLKGTKPENMPRLSKKRGKHKPQVFKELRGISHHKVCLLTAIDEHDNILFKVAGLGVERKEILEPFKDRFLPKSIVTCDEKRCLEAFIVENGMKADIIPANGYKSENERTLADINQLHQELSDLLRRKHGVSIRHLQGYINWLVFRKQLKYKIEGRRQQVEAYIDVMTKTIDLIIQQICKKPLPINLAEAYAEYLN